MSEFVPRPNREVITHEPDPKGTWTPQFPEMIGYSSQGGGHVPEDLEWNTNPKQVQEELTQEKLEHQLERVKRTPELPK